MHPTGRPWPSIGAGSRGFDLTLSPSKSVSLVWALGTDHDAREVEEALYAARDEVERYLEANACFVRRGHAGVDREPGTGFTGAVFLHRTSRLGDPGIHLHWTVFNVAEGPTVGAPRWMPERCTTSATLARRCSRPRCGGSWPRA